MLKRPLIFILLILSLVLAACGSAGGQPDVSTNLSVNMTDFMFEPKDLAIPAGQEVTLTLTNNGAVEHNFVILKKGETASGNFDHDASLNKILFEAKVGPGRDGTYIFTIPEAGEYQIICSVPGHLAAGMTAKLTVK